eukprot:scaffold279836_cov31-Tisochrysis_lutea.AAC.2
MTPAAEVDANPLELRDARLARQFGVIRDEEQPFSHRNERVDNRYCTIGNRPRNAPQHTFTAHDIGIVRRKGLGIQHDPVCGYEIRLLRRISRKSARFGHL